MTKNLCFLLLLAMLSACTQAPSGDKSPGATNENGITDKHSYGFAQRTSGADAIQLKDGGYVIVGYLIDVEGRNKRDSLVEYFTRGFILNVDANLQQRWVQVFELGNATELKSVLAINDSLFACFGFDDDGHALRFLTIDLQGNVHTEKQIDVSSGYKLQSAVRCADGHFVVSGSLGMGADHILIHKLSIDGEVIFQRQIQDDNSLMVSAPLISTSDGNLLVAVGDNFQDKIRLIKMDCNLKTIWEQEIAGSHDPRLETISNGYYLLYHFEWQSRESGWIFTVINENGRIVKERDVDLGFSAGPEMDDMGSCWTVDCRMNGAHLSEMSAAGDEEWGRDFEIDSLLDIQLMAPMTNDRIFMMGELQTYPSLSINDRKMVLFYVDAKHE